jgi:hypothetical protein
MGLSIKEAAQLVRKSARTIKAWRAEGIDVTNREELIEHSELKDVRARGSSAVLARRRLERKPAPTPRLDLRQYFRPGLSPEKFVEIPLPCSQEIASRSLDTLTSVRDAFARRLEELKAIGHEHSVKLSQADLDDISEALRLLEKVTEGFEA